MFGAGINRTAAYAAVLVMAVIGLVVFMSRKLEPIDEDVRDHIAASRIGSLEDCIDNCKGDETCELVWHTYRLELFFDDRYLSSDRYKMRILFYQKDLAGFFGRRNGQYCFFPDAEKYIYFHPFGRIRVLLPVEHYRVVQAGKTRGKRLVSSA